MPTMDSVVPFNVTQAHNDYGANAHFFPFCLPVDASKQRRLAIYNNKNSDIQLLNNP